MFDVHRVEREIGGKLLSIETGKIARQADGAVTVQCGETVILAAATSSKAREDIDYFPLSVDYREKLSAAGKFPGGFMKREGRPSQKEILTARTVDRPIRPLFPDEYNDEVQIMISVLSADQENDPDILAMIGASAALSISKIPFMGPLGACRLSIVEGNHVINPTHEERERSTFNLILGGRSDAINMIEVDAKQTPDDTVADAIEEAHKSVKATCELIEELVAKVNPEKIVVEPLNTEDIEAELKDKVWNDFREAYQIVSKGDRSAKLKEIQDAVKEEYLKPEDGSEPKYEAKAFTKALGNVEKNVVRELLLEGKRPDGRGYDDVRPIECEVGLLPRAHGSALFTRGETQALVSVTLGTTRDVQTVDGLLEEYGQSFMLHYNFPPYSVGECRPIRGPGRREIGHGVLAEKALEQVRPSEKDFPYTIKIVSDITESNGSSSQASICGGCLAMLDAGVPLAKPVAGISIGMISDGGRYELLTDILGDEDHFGDMDFKIAGTDEGITAIQLDIKAEGLPFDQMRAAIKKARTARMKILDSMSKAIEKPHELSEYAPRIVKINIDPDSIGKIIGPGGKTIRNIQEETNSTINIEEDGEVTISSVGGDGHMLAKEIIEAMTTPPVVGKIYKNSKVVSVKDFGVFVEICPGVEGLCHISELAEGFVKNVEDICKEGDVIPVKLLLIDDQGRFKLSRKAALADMEKSEE
ncbi:Polyribonucleotide nucleotidyltransferase [Anaerohalosphaera lusitana]|uniref:Polyribonucleotide nucleotidyltransferase n=1 Tax=Anaerohalosphaera lusitana TaxID=1936003 RepID=A0A1U9NM58_9BACT|nr:polyribonucleotide nucleotidyltransferase [Anaerohalosphaera lusitana]AQT68915.1 Polyribonucleotide nucleotidyltransferase [Anaerohalosphaera lusitana]